MYHSPVRVLLSDLFCIGLGLQVIPPLQHDVGERGEDAYEPEKGEDKERGRSYS